MSATLTAHDLQHTSTSSSKQLPRTSHQSSKRQDSEPLLCPSSATSLAPSASKSSASARRSSALALCAACDDSCALRPAAGVVKWNMTSAPVRARKTTASAGTTMKPLRTSFLQSTHAHRFVGSGRRHQNCPGCCSAVTHPQRACSILESIRRQHPPADRLICTPIVPPNSLAKDLHKRGLLLDAHLHSIVVPVAPVSC